MTTLFLLLLTVLAAYSFARIDLSRARLQQYDKPMPLVKYRLISAEMQERLQELLALETPKGTWKEKLAATRIAVDEFGNGNFETQFVTTTVAGCSAEWVLCDNYRSDRRLLYLHGGGFYVGSAKSHRPITCELARRTGCAVLVINYRLMPEHSRMEGILDAQCAYRWLLKNGPDNESEPRYFALAGDSAGGNLALMLSAWSRDSCLRKADAVVALAPATDAGLESPSIRANAQSDPILGPLIAKTAWMPGVLLFYINWTLLKTKPTSPLVSPVRGDLSALPSTLIQVSGSEVLYHDAIRYINKSKAQGSHAELQVWPGLPHVWHGFGSTISEVDEAFTLISTFLNNAMPR